MSIPSDTKIVHALNYLASHSSEKKLNKMKAIKLLWLADRYHLRKYARTITNDCYYAMPFGPVPSRTKEILDGKVPIAIVTNSLKNINQYYYGSAGEINYDVFSESDIEVLDLILKYYGEQDQFSLSELSHKSPEWLRFEDCLKRKASSYKMNMCDFFVNFEEVHNLFKDNEDDINLAKDLYIEMM